MIDNVAHHQTPEGIELSLVPAGITARVGAWLLDFCIRMALLYGLRMILAFFDEFGFGLLLISYFLIDWFYPVVFEVFGRGQTIGKKQFGIQVCQDDGTPIRWQASMTRNLLRVADFLPFAFFAGIISMLFHRSSKRLGDIVAGTMVVYVDNYRVGYDIPERPPVALPMPLQLDEQQAVLAFAERVDTLVGQREFELAGILGELAGKPTSQMPEQILGYANTIIGFQQDTIEKSSPVNITGQG